MELGEQLSQVVTRQDLARFVAAMAEAAESMETLDWENTTLPDFLEALAGFINDMGGAFRNRGEAEPEQPSWQLVGRMLYTATIYE